MKKTKLTKARRTALIEELAEMRAEAMREDVDVALDMAKYAKPLTQMTDAELIAEAGE